jgi:ATP-binding cassette subfamily F protein 3
VEWLEGYLKDWEGAILIVSHDRYFMDNVVSTVWELDFGEIAAYRGNYSHYVSQREARYERLVKEYEAQQAFIQKEQDYIQRNIAGQNTAQAKGRRRRLERLMSGTNRFGQATDKPWLVQRPRRRSKHLGLALDASDAGRTGHEVLKTRGLEIGYPDHSGPLFQVPDILLVRQEVAAIIGPNGAGKSTFLKTILGELTAWQGEYAWGANVKLGYFAQAHERLTEANSILDELLEVKNLPLSKARDYLARYQFTGEDVYRPVATLSGGERGRLALAKLALDGANVLLLDEPTNHLDIASQEVLQNVLADYEGTILLVSHDRYLIDALATQIWAIKPGQMIAFQGSYRAYLEDLANTGPPGGSTGGDDNGRRSRRTNRNGSTTDEHPSGLNPYQRQQRLEQLEGMIHQLEAEIAEISGALEAASAAGNVDAVAELGQKYAATEDQLNDTMAEWMHLA